MILGLHGQKPPSQIPQRSLPSYDERFYSLGVLRCHSFCNIDTSVDFLISREDYPRASLVGMSIRDESFSLQFFLHGGRLESPSEAWLFRRQPVLFEVGLAISSRHVAFEKRIGFSDKAGRRIFYPGICLICLPPNYVSL